MSVNGDIAGYETIYVIPEESFDLYSKNKDSQEALITQDKIAWSFEEFDKEAIGYVNAPDITAGYWSGTFYFNIQLIEEKVLGDIILPEDIELDDDYQLILTKIQKEPGLYNELGELIIPWSDLVGDYNFDPEVDNIISYDEVSLEDDPEYIEALETNNQEKLEKYVSTSSSYHTYKVEEVKETSASYILNTYFKEAKYVSLPSSVSSIGTANFANTNISFVYMPSSIKTIKDYAFGGSSIQTASIPDTVTYVGSGVYSDTLVQESASKTSEVYYGRNAVKQIEVNLENKDAAKIILEKGYSYQITALYNFYNDVTKQSTIKTSDASVVKFSPDCFLDAVNCGKATISGTYTTKSGKQKEATIEVVVIETDSKTDNSVKAKPVKLTETDTAVVQNVGKIKMKVLNVAALDVDTGGTNVAPKLSFKSDDESICKVLDGRVYALSEGKTKVHMYYTFKKYYENSTENITNEYIYDIVVSGKLNRNLSNDYENTAQLLADYIKAPVGEYLDQPISIGKSLLTCDVYRVPDGTVLTSSVFKDCVRDDDDTQIIVGKNLSVAAGTILTPPHRCKGIFILDAGTFTNDGTISMTARGAQGTGLDIPLVEGYQIDAVGGAGGAGAYAKKTPSSWSYYNGAGNPGKTATGISCAGGGSGSTLSSFYTIGTSAVGGTGTSFSGGAGSGGSGFNGNSITQYPSNIGGRGGNGMTGGGYTCALAGGAGNPGGYAYDSIGNYWCDAYAGETGTGGLLVIVANDLINNGSLTSCGSRGGYIQSKNGGGGWFLHASGGSSGGGCIVLISNEITQNGSYSVAGGAATPATGYGAAGGAGGTGTYKEIISTIK